jgi:uncharacterized protein with HEPN domain
VTRDRARLLEILDAIARVQRHAAAGQKAFFEDERVHDAVLYRIGSVGESVKGLSSPFKARHPEVPWKQMAGIRDIVNHKYYGIDLTIIWNTIENEFPPLKASVERILASDPELQG